MPSHSQIIKEIEDYIEELRWMKEDEVKVKPQTAGWKPPTEIPSNWRLIKAGIDGAAYQSRNGLKVILSCCIEADEKNWVHLSVSRKNRLPDWAEFTQVKEIFLGKEALAIQVLAPRSEWVNHHPYCLHLYQCLDERPIPDFRKLGTI